MVQKINRLPSAVINQIAAGEVVENPASIVKELIENSLDAGALSISVAIRGGGHLFIEIEDDGCGMNEQDALLCLERHTTSKIRSVQDLESLTTMGFRGEALSSISSVSHFELKTSDGFLGTFIQVKGGEIENVIPCARNRGTTITIRSLFFNVPARKKFQKSASSSTAQIRKIIETISCAHPEVAFSFISQGQKVLEIPCQTRRERIETIFGHFPHTLESPGLWGLLSAPANAKNRRGEQFLFINKRPVFSPLIAKAVQLGYGTRLAENMYPPFVLFLQIDPSEVDVNVHPQKKEVRLSNESALFEHIEKAVRELFAPKAGDCSSLFFTQPAPFLLTPEPQFFSPIPQELPLPLEFPERPLIIVGNYLLLEKDSLLLMDIAAAHARVLFDDFKNHKKDSQALLWPLEIDIDQGDDITALQDLGIECRHIGEKKIAVDALPSSLDVSSFPLFFTTWQKEKNISLTTVRFCRNLKKRYSLEEAIHLFRRSQTCSDNLYDPSGKRIFAKIEPKDLDSWISRA